VRVPDFAVAVTAADRASAGADIARAAIGIDTLALGWIRPGRGRAHLHRPA